MFLYLLGSFDSSTFNIVIIFLKIDRNYDMTIILYYHNKAANLTIKY
jgi:hypothetical protein